jgi:hypothetical protein
MLGPNVKFKHANNTNVLQFHLQAAALVTYPIVKLKNKPMLGILETKLFHKPVDRAQAKVTAFRLRTCANVIFALNASKDFSSGVGNG